MADPLTAADSAIDDYADHYFEYDSSHRVTTHTVSAEGCSSCGGGQGTHSYTYMCRTELSSHL